MAEEKDQRPTSASQLPKHRAPLPPLSLIPSLGTLELDSGKPKVAYPKTLKESDSRYVRLAKLGGRKDLLSMPQVEEPEKRVPLPRKPTTTYGANFQLLQTTFATSSKKNPGVELLAPGFGKERLDCANPLLDMPRNRTKSDLTGGRVFGALAAEEGMTRMDKLLANTYQKEWQERARAYHGEVVPPASMAPKAASEYKQSFGPIEAILHPEPVRRITVNSRLRVPFKKREAQLNPLPACAYAERPKVGKKPKGRSFVNKCKGGQSLNSNTK